MPNNSLVGVVNESDDNLGQDIPDFYHMVGVENIFDEDFDPEIPIFDQKSLDTSAR